MSIFDKLDKTKIHTRQISTETYVVDEDHLLVEGVLKDDRTKESCRSTGKIIPAGTIHHMVIQLLPQVAFTCNKDPEVKILSAPYPECLETCEVMNGMKGVPIASGFSKKVRSIAGGPRGCVHWFHYCLLWAKLFCNCLKGVRSSAENRSSKNGEDEIFLSSR